MKRFVQRTLLSSALLAATAASAATGLPGSSDASMFGAPVDHLAQHRAQRTHIAATVMQLAQASQATPAPSNPVAQSPGMSAGQGNGMQQDQQTSHRAAHRDALKAKLQLSPEQETAWLALTARLEASHGQHRRPGANPVDRSQLTTPERLDRMQARMTERQEAMNQRIEAIKSFYAVLSPEQQKVFDSHAQGVHPRAGMGKMGHHGHRHPKPAGGMATPPQS